MGSPFVEVPTVPVVVVVPPVVEVVEIPGPWLPTTPTLDVVTVPDDEPTWLPVEDVLDVAGGAGWPIPIGFWNVALGCVATGAPLRVEELDPEPEDVPVPEPTAAAPPPFAKAGITVQTTTQEARARIGSVSLLEAMVRSYSGVE
jgi:hypothetical protein